MATNNGSNIEVVPGGTAAYTFPAATDTLVGRASNDAMTNKKVNGQSFLQNFSTADQQIAAATTALLTGSLITVPSGLLEIGTIFRFTITVSKTAAGTAANTFLFKLGTAGTTSDATILTFTTGVGTAVVDTGTINIFVTIRGPLSASCIAQGHFSLTHNLSATGLLAVASNSIDVTSGTFNSTTAGLKASISCTTAASTVLTFKQVIAEAMNL